MPSKYTVFLRIPAQTPIRTDLTFFTTILDLTAKNAKTRNNNPTAKNKEQAAIFADCCVALS